MVLVLILIKEVSQKCKFKILLIAGAVALVIGLGIDWTGVIRIIKRIATSSFVLGSGGWALIGLAISFWLYKKKIFFRI